MEAHKDSNKRALGLHYTRQTVATHTDKCGAASSRPIRTTSTSPPEALLHRTRSSQLHVAAASSMAAAISCEHKRERRG